MVRIDINKQRTKNILIDRGWYINLRQRNTFREIRKSRYVDDFAKEFGTD